MRQNEGTVITDRGGGRQRADPARVLPHHRADRGARRAAARRSGQPRRREQHDAARRDHADAADQRRVPGVGGRPRRAVGAAEPRRRHRGHACSIARARTRSRPARCTRSTTRSTRRPAPCACARCSTTPTSALFPNQFVNTRVLVTTLRGVDHGAVVGDPARRREGVRVRARGRARARRAGGGGRERRRAHQVQGLAPGAQVANSSFEKLREGVRSGSRTAARRAGGGGIVSPSRPFILRPVATSLLMVGDPARRARRVHAAAGLGAAAGRLPDDPGADVLSGREPGGHLDHGDRAARAPVRPDPGAAPDDLDERRRASR